jgi:hypothetical protein
MAKLQPTDIFLIVVVFIAALFSSVLALNTNATSWFNNLKSFEIALQFFSVTVLGGAVALFYRRMEARRARREVRRKALEDFYRGLVAFHHQCKRVRRMLRGATFSELGKCKCERQRFEQLMAELEDVQLMAETLVREVDTRKDLFESAQSDLHNKLSNAEGYLRALLRQFEDKLVDRRGLAPTDPIELSPELVEFIARRQPSSSPSKTKYFERVRDAQRLLIQLIDK